MVSKVALKNTEEAALFLKEAHEGPLVWERFCLKLQRMARGLPIVYPSALTAQLATPESERVYKIEDLRRGMIAYSDDPNDNNPSGHVYFIAGRNKLGQVLTWTNDAIRTGGVDIVPIDFYRKNWGDKFQFGATWLNGYDFSEFDKPPVETRGRLGDNYAAAIEDLEKIERHHRSRGHIILADKLKKDLERMKRRLKNHSN